MKSTYFKIVLRHANKTVLDLSEERQEEEQACVKQRLENYVRIKCEEAAALSRGGDIQKPKAFEKYF